MNNHTMMAFGLMIVIIMLAGCIQPVATEAVSTATTSETGTMPTTQPTLTEIAAEATEPVSTETPPPTPEPTGTCDHPFFPVMEDVIWTYRTMINGWEDSESGYTVSYRGVAAKSFLSVLTMGDPAVETITMETSWQCGEEGLLAQEYTQFLYTDPDEKGTYEFETLEFSGITLPIPSAFVMGAEWANHYKVHLLTHEDGVTYEGDLTVDQTSKLTAMEPVSVPSGDFEHAYRVDTQSVLTLAFTNEDGNGTYQYTYTTSTWYVEGVGMIKVELIDEDGIAVVELVSMSE